MTSPLSQTFWVGHKRVMQTVDQFWKTGRFPQGVIFSGAAGVGKATFAYRLARFLLSSPQAQDTFSTYQDQPETPLFRRIVAQGHGDLKVATPEKAGGYISVEAIRDVNRFLSQTPLEGGWRIVIIDGEINRNGANALLKTLEEPPQKTVLILLTSALGRLMPTLRSRCQLCHFDLLSTEEIQQGLRQTYPLENDAKLAQVAALSHGSLGLAHTLYTAGGLEIYEDLLQVLGALKPYRAGAINAFCRKYSKKPLKDQVHDPLQILALLMVQWIYRLIQSAVHKKAVPEIVPGETQVMRQVFSLHPVQDWATLWTKTQVAFEQIQSLSLERFQGLVGIFSDLSGR